VAYLTGQHTIGKSASIKPIESNLAGAVQSCAVTQYVYALKEKE
jgi:hypothetical protein